ncbi:hypothetical protein OPQ81_000269 [Rhizoctonia solani]|nr:hypothetical protein OPQ81_000269 [Rhizoctonia solani]
MDPILPGKYCIRVYPRENSASHFGGQHVFVTHEGIGDQIRVAPASEGFIEQRWEVFLVPGDQYSVYIRAIGVNGDPDETYMREGNDGNVILGRREAIRLDSRQYSSYGHPVYNLRALNREGDDGASRWIGVLGEQVIATSAFEHPNPPEMDSCLWEFVNTGPPSSHS